MKFKLKYTIIPSWKCIWKSRLRNSRHFFYQRGDELKRMWHHNIFDRHISITDDTQCWFGHSMMTSSNGNIFRVTGPLCGEFTGPGEFPTQRPVTRSFDVFFFICVWINNWVNNREAGDLRRYSGHYDVIVMLFTSNIVYIPGVFYTSTSHYQHMPSADILPKISMKSFSQQVATCLTRTNFGKIRFLFAFYYGCVGKLPMYKDLHIFPRGIN